MAKGVLVPENEDSSDEDGATAAAEESLDYNEMVFVPSEEQHKNPEELGIPLRSSVDAVPKGDYMAILQVRLH